jgi:fibronectin-binding autotransporter adhesin
VANEKISAMTDIVAGHSSDILPLVRSGDTTNYSISLAEITAFINAGTGTVTSVVAGAGLGGGTITGAGTLTNAGLIEAIQGTVAVTGTLTFGTGTTLNAGGTVTAGGTGTVTSVALSGGTTGLTVSGSPITGAGTLTLGGLVFGTMAVENSNSVTITGGTITGMPTPSAATDVANKSYVDAAIAGLQIKQTATVATTAALPTNTYSNGASGVGATITIVATGTLTVDGHVTALGDYVLVKNEATAANNGLYIATTAGAIGVAAILTRATDMNVAADFSGALVPVGATGTANANSLWLCNPSTPVTVGTTAIPFTQLNGATDLIPGANIGISGNTISVISTLPVSVGGTGQTAWTAGDLVYASGTGTLSNLLPGANISITSGTLNAAGSVSSIVAGTGLSGGTITSTGTVAVTAATTAALGGVIVGAGLSVSGGTISNAGVTSLVAGNSTTITSGNTIGVSSIAAGVVSSNGTVLEATTLGSGLSWASGTLSVSNSGTGTVTSVALSGGSTGLTVSGSPVTTAGTMTLAGTLGIGYGGTGLTAFAAGTLVYASGTATLTGLTPSANFTEASSTFDLASTISVPGVTPLVNIISSESGSLPTASSGALVVMAGTSGLSTDMDMLAFGNTTTIYPQITMLLAGGTKASPTALTANRIMSRNSSGGYDGTAWTGTAASVQVRTINAWTTADHSTQLLFNTTPTGSVSVTAAATLSNALLAVAGSLTLGSALGVPYGGTGNASWTTGDLVYASGTATLANAAIGSGLSLSGGTLSNSGIVSLVAGNSATITSGNTIGVSTITAGVVSSNGTILEATTLATGLTWSAGTLTLSNATTAAVGGVIVGAGLAVSSGTISASQTFSVGIGAGNGQTLPADTYDLGISQTTGTLVNGTAHVVSGGTITYTAAIGTPASLTNVTGLAAITQSSNTDTTTAASAANTFTAGQHLYVIIANTGTPLGGNVWFKMVRP